MTRTWLILVLLWPAPAFAAITTPTAVEDTLDSMTLPHVMEPMEEVKELGTCTITMTNCAFWSDDQISCFRPDDYREQCMDTLRKVTDESEATTPTPEATAP